MTGKFLRITGFIALLGVPVTASAISCDEIMNMVNVSVPTNIVMQTIDASGTRFSADDIRCLSGKGAPPEIVEQARRLSVAETPQPTRVTNTPPPPAPDPEPADDFDNMDSLGGGSGGGFVSEEADVDEGGGPPKLNQLVKLYQAKKVLTSSKGLYDLLASNEYPEYEDKIHYYLAKSLYDLEMYHGAQHHFMQVVRKGPKNPYFKYALPKLVAISKINGNDTELLRIVDKVPPEAFPRQARNHLNYLRGRQAYADGELTESSTFLRQVSAKSDVYMRAKYFEGVIHTERDKLKSSVKAFRDVYQAEILPTDERQLKEFESLKDLALLNIARTYYGIERYDNSINYYEMVSRDSSYWPDSLYERAWAELILNDLDGSLGALLTLQSPHFALNEFLPESEILRAIAFFSLCKWQDTEFILDSFQARYKPMMAEMKSFLQTYEGREGMKLADQAFDAYFTNPHPASKLNKSLFSRVLRNNDLSGLVRHMDMMDEELDLIGGQKSVWRSSVGAHLTEIIEKDRARYKRKAGLVLLKEIANQYQILKDLNGQADIIRFELVDAQRKDYQYKASQPVVESREEKVIDFATDRKTIYWPFNGEFWQDELGYYRYAEKQECD